jgi:carbon-monoxide dehydrogenase medium subunit
MILPLPELPSFDYVRPKSYQQVSELLHQQPEDARPFMGGTDIFIQMRDRTLAPKILIDLKHLPGMTSIEYDHHIGLRLGAAVNMNAVAKHPEIIEYFPLLVEAANSVASYQLRNRATIGGNLCNASPAADMAPAFLILDADLIVVGLNGERVISVNDFFLAPGENALGRGEILKRIEIPPPPDCWKGKYLKLGRNAEGDLAIAGVAVLGFPDQTTASGYRFRIALSSVAPTPIRAFEAENILSRGPIPGERIEAASIATQDACQPIDDVRASGNYRKAMVSVLTRRGLEEVWAAVKKEG